MEAWFRRPSEEPVVSECNEHYRSRLEKPTEHVVDGLVKRVARQIVIPFSKNDIAELLRLLNVCYLTQ